MTTSRRSSDALPPRGFESRRSRPPDRGGRSAKTGLAFGTSQAAAIPFQGGFLCAGGQAQRGPPTTISASGTASMPVTIAPNQAGTSQFFQWWFRDPPAPFGTGLSNGLQVTYCP